MGPGAIEVNQYQTEIFDIVRRRGVFGQRIKQVPATGHPSRYFEQTAIASPSAANGFVDPRNIVAVVGSPTRVERSVPLKALVSQINYNLFDIEVGAQQKQFAYLQAKDLADSVDGLMRTHDVALWNGNDTSLSASTTLQYFGACGQIRAGGNVATIGRQQQHRRRVEVDDRRDGGELQLRSAADGDLRQPGAAGPDRPRDEGGVQRGALDQGDHGWTYGEDVDHPGRRAAADSGVGSALHGTPGSGSATLPAYIVTEDLIEYHWLTDANPRVFQLGLTGTLAHQLMVVKFGAVVVKGANYAHYLVNVTR